MIRTLMKWLRLRKACAAWNDDITLIRAVASESGTPNAVFKWGQLVWQEIWMYISLGKQVDPVEFHELCERRGFDWAMCEYLRKMLVRVGLGKRLVSEPLVKTE